MNVIKEIRMLTGAGLAEAKNLSERTPTVLKEGISETEAQQKSRILLQPLVLLKKSIRRKEKCQNQC